MRYERNKKIYTYQYNILIEPITWNQSWNNQKENKKNIDNNNNKQQCTMHNVEAYLCVCINFKIIRSINACIRTNHEDVNNVLVCLFCNYSICWL